MAEKQETSEPIDGRTNENESVVNITGSLLSHIKSIADSTNAAAIFIYIDAMPGVAVDEIKADSQKLFLVTKKQPPDPISKELPVNYLRIPNVPLTRMSQVKVALFLALSRGLVCNGDTVVFLAGLSRTACLDTIIVSQVGKEYEMLAEDTAQQKHLFETPPEVLERILDIASEIGKEGREGHLIGALFVIGDTEKVVPLTKQLILNPFKGYAESQRNILDVQLEETIKELATIDGAFVIRSDGVIESCGTYIKTTSQEEFELPRGLGARHHAAAGITAVTDSVAIVVSASTGTVSVFHHGNIVTEIEKPRSLGQTGKSSK